MNVVTKKKIVCFSSDILAAFSISIAFMCLAIKIKNLSDKPYLNKINLFAAESIISNPLSITNLKKYSFFKKCKSNIPEFTADTNSVQLQNEPLVNPQTHSNKNLLPNETSKQATEETHVPGEKKYKIIESYFGKGGTKCENFYIKNSTNQNLNFTDLLHQKANIKITKTSKPQVLIFHTHTSESYMFNDQGFFYESFYPRSLNNSKNVIKVGDAITEKLNSHNIQTIHDTTYHDNPTYNGSYSRASKTIRKNLEKNPSIQVVIDIHRDSLGNRETGKIKPTFKYENKKAAQMMIVSGCDSDGSLGFPDWIKNLRLALKIQKYCETMFPGITRPLHFANVKYNEHITPGSLLIEVGSDVNTLEEATNTGTLIGEALARLFEDLKE